MIIWGSRGLTSTVETGQFHCPQCSTARGYNLRQVRTFFTLYFIPLIPLNVSGRFVECGSCGGTFAEEAKSYDPVQEQQETNDQMRRVMVLAALADGQVDDGERVEIEKQCMELSGLPVPAATLDNDISMAVSSGTDLTTYVGLIANELSPHGKALVVKVAFQTMSASPKYQQGHKAQLENLGTALGIPRDQYVELIKQLRQQAQNG